MLRIALFLQYSMLILVYFSGEGEDSNTMLFCNLLYLVTSLVYGAIVSLMPILCSQVFGPQSNGNMLSLL